MIKKYNVSGWGEEGGQTTPFIIHRAFLGCVCIMLTITIYEKTRDDLRVLDFDMRMNFRRGENL